MQGTRGDRSSNHPQPNAAYPNKGKHIPFCLLIKSWLVNQTSGSCTSLSFEGKALFPRLPPASCGSFSSSSNTTNYTTFVCYELALPLPGQGLDSDHCHKCLIMGHKPNKASPSLNISGGEEKITVKWAFPCISSGVSHSWLQIRGFLEEGWGRCSRQIVFTVRESENKTCKARVYLREFLHSQTFAFENIFQNSPANLFSAPLTLLCCLCCFQHLGDELKVSAQTAANPCRNGPGETQQSQSQLKEWRVGTQNFCAT